MTIGLGTPHASFASNEDKRAHCGADNSRNGMGTIDKCTLNFHALIVLESRNTIKAHHPDKQHYSPEHTAAKKAK